mmetsp:Transcript_107094/g.333822  ORF Transcript_107094/g.333822 Transcript_107094/m.333822 type:complete len:140 (-) Transcript_107094:15-434(-)
MVLINPAIPALMWAGSVVCIGVEAVAKFKAPLLERKVAVDVGRTVFAAVEKLEWLFVAGTAAAVYANPSALPPQGRLLLGAALAARTLQSLFVQPVLAERALAIAAGKDVPPSKAHVFFVAADAVKIVSLVTFGVLATA